ncbi:hypothetical protein C0989_001224 [Termitomyces sp. Mn162]|nr:hypothetical protein C0989_001224 [Termitomyces sp. Mn162]
MQGTLGINTNLQNELHALVEEIHTSLNLHLFEDPLDPSHSFHVQCKKLIRTQSKAQPPISYQQEEVNMASNILRNLNSMGGLFNQPTACILALSAHPWANSIPSAFCIWNQPDATKPSKPITFQLESSQVAFATLYLQGIIFNHYMALLWFDPNNSILSSWLAFTQEFSSKFSIFDTVVEAEENLFNL